MGKKYVPGPDCIYICATKGKPKYYIEPDMVDSWKCSTYRTTKWMEDLIIFDGYRFFFDDCGNIRTTKVSNEIFFYAMGLHYRKFALGGGK